MIAMPSVNNSNPCVTKNCIKFFMFVPPFENYLFFVEHKHTRTKRSACPLLRYYQKEREK